VRRSETVVLSPLAGLRDLRLVGKQLRYEQLSFWLNPVMALFTLGFSLLFMVILGGIVGSARVPYLANIKVIQYYVPGLIAYGVIAACFTMLAIGLVNRREAGLLKRLRLSPLPTWALLASIFLSMVVVVVIQVALMLAVGRWAYGVRMPPHPAGGAAVAFALLVGVISFTALGVAMSTLVPNADSAGPLIATVFFVLLALSGFWFPLKSGSLLAKISDWFPIRHFILALFAPFDGQGGSPWAWRDVRDVALWGVAGVIIAVWRFRWEPRRG
jgi:ABC-2 type transport system permease protein